MSALRELPPDQEVKPSHWSRFRLVPLLVLFLGAAVALVGGYVWQAAHPYGVAIPEPTAAPGEPLPDACTPEFHRDGAADPWGTDPAAAEAVFQQHAAELDGYFVEGRDGHLLLGEPHSQNISQALGRFQATDDHVAAWNAYLSNTRAALEADGRELLVVVAPAKWETVPEALPAWTEGLLGPTVLDGLLAAHPELPIVDVRAAMEAADDEHALYSPLNSHWTDYGAWVAFDALAGCMREVSPAFADVEAPAITDVTLEPDHSEYGAAGWTGEPGRDWTVPTYGEPASAMEASLADGSTQQLDTTAQLDMLQLPATTRTADASTDHTALVLRDSTGNGLGPSLHATFAETMQVVHSLDRPDLMPDAPALAAEIDADVVLLVLTERYLALVPGVGPVP
ncbi:alginate O-acetyltransferase AlgX-related protein [Agrococcus sp. DT81.2]|uniref:alginate O-acetyltransferase AlgX-related protein n=1 Tax=Agrococcus sp. DT81.2 TaxID=3393414 RepID=UPI003CE57CC6